MASNFRYISTKFYNEYYNDDGTGTFPLNLSDFTPYLKGNPGELVKVVRQVELQVSVNELRNLSIQYVATNDATFGTFVAEGIDWRDEGLFDGCQVDVILNRGQKTIATIDVDTISGVNNSVLRLDKTQLTQLTDGKTYTDIEIRLITAPKWLKYQYGLIGLDATSADYKSPIDGSDQAYYNTAIPDIAFPREMTRFGRIAGSDLTTSLTIAYDNTTSSKYLFIYEIAHTFRIPFYKEGEQGNLALGVRPNSTRRPISMKYACRFEFGGTTSDVAAQFEDLGTFGDVGYFNENFDGREGFYSVINYAVSNASNTGKLEATETNTVTFSIQSNTPVGFSGGEEIILSHSKLPTQNEAQFKTDAWSDIWLFDSVRQTEGQPAVSSTRLSNVTVTLNAGNLDVSADVSFPPDDQDRMSSIDDSFIYLTIATQNTTDPQNTDRSNVSVKAAQYSKDEQVTGIVTSQQPDIYPESQYDAGTSYTNFNGYNGDLLGQSTTFRVALGQNPIITGLRFMVVADDGTDYFELYGYSFPISQIALVEASGFQSQILDVDNALDFNIPSTELINRAKVEALLPGSGNPFQDWKIDIGFQIPWREWIANSNVPTAFTLYNQENQNRNNRTSNYSGSLGYTIKTLIRVQTQVDDLVNQQSITTFYELFSDSSTILDFDNAAGNGFSLSFDYFDSNGDPTGDIPTNSDGQIDAVFSHSSGTLSSANLFGYIWILPKNGTGQPWFLSTEIDNSNPLNPLKPTDSLMSGNLQFVEIISTLNQVILRCGTDKDNLIENTDYKIYARLYPK